MAGVVTITKDSEENGFVIWEVKADKKGSVTLEIRAEDGRERTSFEVMVGNTAPKVDDTVTGLYYELDQYPAGSETIDFVYSRGTGSAVPCRKVEYVSWRCRQDGYFRDLR